MHVTGCAFHQSRLRGMFVIDRLYPHRGKFIIDRLDREVTGLREAAE